MPATLLAAVDVKEILPHDLAYSFAVVRDPLKRLESEFRYQSGVSQMSKLGFSLWLKVILKAARAEPRLYENHIRPQSDLVPEGAEVFKLEEGFDAMIAALDRVTGCAVPEVSVPHINSRSKEPIVMCRADVAAVTAFYATDYNRFGYPKPDLNDYVDCPPRWCDRLASPLATLLVHKQRRD